MPRRAPKREDGGWLVGPFLDYARGVTGIAVFDARHVADGPVALVWLEYPLPLAFAKDGRLPFRGPTRALVAIYPKLPTVTTVVDIWPVCVFARTAIAVGAIRFSSRIRAHTFQAWRHLRRAAALWN